MSRCRSCSADLSLLPIHYPTCPATPSGEERARELDEWWANDPRAKRLVEGHLATEAQGEGTAARGRAKP